MEEATIVWTEYIKYRLSLRGYDLATVEQILRYSSERSMDAVTGRVVAIGRQEKLLVMIPYELKRSTLTPVTIHATSRQQITKQFLQLLQSDNPLYQL
jgi:hypothetical protein